METRQGFTGEDGAAGVRAGTGAAQALLQGWRRGAAEPRRLLLQGARLPLREALACRPPPQPSPAYLIL